LAAPSYPAAGLAVYAPRPIPYTSGLRLDRRRVYTRRPSVLNP